MRLMASLFLLAALLSGSRLCAGVIPGDINGDGICDRNDSTSAFFQAWTAAHPDNTWTAAAAYLDMLLAGPQPKPVYRLFGLCFGPYYGTHPSDDAMTDAEVRWLVDGIAPYCSCIRTFAAMGPPAVAAAYAKSLGLQVWAGCSLNGTASDTAEISALLTLISQGVVDVAVVGNETLLRGDLTPLALHNLITQVKGHGVPVTTADTWYALINNSGIMSDCDAILANFYPFWEKIPVDHAMAVTNDHYNDLVAANPGKAVYVGEAGWPSAGTAQNLAVPSSANAAAFFESFVSWARARSVAYTYFEALDEPWKIATEGDVGPHWGLWQYDSSGFRLKPAMILPIRGETVADNWTAPSLFFTHVPAYGSTTDFDLWGLATGVNPAQYRVAVYIRVDGNWWPKPTFTDLVPLGAYRVWNCDIDTGRYGGGHDQLADKIYAFLIPNTYTPPVQSGGLAAIPAEVFSNSLASCTLDR